MAQVDLLVVQLMSGDPLDGLVDGLREHDAVNLITPNPVSLDDALPLIAEHRDADVVLLLGPKQLFRDAIRRIRDHHRSIHIASIEHDSGAARFMLIDPNIDGLVRILASLGQAKRWWFGAGKVRFLHRPPAPEPMAPKRERPITGVPMTIEQPEVEPENLRVITAGLAWLDLATESLIEALGKQRPRTLGLTPDWETWRAWLAAVLQLLAASAEQQEHCFRQFLSAIQSTEGRATPFGRLAALLGDDPLALKVVLIACASEFELRFERAFGVLQDDYARKRPSLGLACTLLAAAQNNVSPLRVRAELDLNAPLRRLGLHDALGLGGERADEPLRPPPGLTEWLLSGEAERLAEPAGGLLRAQLPATVLDLVPAARDRKVRLRLEAAEQEGSPAAIIVAGSEPGWLLAEVAGVDRNPLIVAPPVEPRSGEDIRANLSQLVLAANLAGHQLVLDLRRDGAPAELLWRQLVDLLDRCVHRPLVVAGEPARLLAQSGPHRISFAQLAPPTSDDRLAAIGMTLAGQHTHDDNLAADLAARFPLPPDRLPQAAALALGEAASQGRPLAPTRADWFVAFRRAASAALPQFAQRIEPSVPVLPPDAQLDRVILPGTQRDQLKELVKHVRFGRTVMAEWGFAELIDGRGVAALFAGESGTGKTTAAHAVASELGCDLFSIDLSQVVSKYIGETEKNLETVFAEAEAAGAALLFDEADALFGKRSNVSDAHDRYANIEVAYLLQRMQRFSGLAMLTTNNAGNLDPAFARRLRFRIEFPRPSAADRLAIWEQSLPPERRAGTLALKPIANAFEVTGGTIRQMAFHAAVLAAERGKAIGMEQIFAGVHSQLVRLGKYDDLARLDLIAGPEKEAA